MKSLRIKEIIDILERERIVKTIELVKYFDVTIETIRRDFDQLEKQGVLTKIYGGAEIVPQTKKMPSPLISRRRKAQAEKAAIAKYVADCIPDNCTIALDAGSTVYELCQHMNKKEKLIIVCGDIHAAQRLLENSKSKIYMMGGFLTPDGTSSGTFAKEFFNNMTGIDYFIFSTDGASVEDGLSSDESGINELKKRYLKSSGTKIAMVDHHKFEHRGFYRTCDFEAIDLLVTDSKTPQDIIKKIERTGTKVAVVPV